MQFEDVYGPEYRRVSGLIISLGASRQDAEEITQDAFTKMLVRWSSIGGYDDPGAWVRHVAVRDWSSRLRQRANRARIDAEQRPTAAPPPEALDERLTVEAAIAGLVLEQRQVLILHYMTDLSLKEIARLLRVPLGTVQSRLARARDALATVLEEEEIRYG